jgi:hypothetical protein
MKKPDRQKAKAGAHYPTPDENARDAQKSNKTAPRKKTTKERTG